MCAMDVYSRPDDNGINKARRGYYDVLPFSSKSTSRRELILLRGGGGGHVCTQQFFFFIIGIFFDREIICRIEHY